MIELNVKYPATERAPEPSSSGKVIHSYYDVTPHQGEEVHNRYMAAQTEEEKEAILREMPRATLTFYELPEGEPFFDTEDDRPRDKNGFAIWDYVWVEEAGDLGTIEASDDDGYDVQIGDKLVRLAAGQFKPLSQMRIEDDAALKARVDEERATARAPTN